MVRPWATHPSAFIGDWEMVLHKKLRNRKSVDKCMGLIRDLCGRVHYLDYDWYNLKYAVHVLHCSYRMMCTLIELYPAQFPQSLPTFVPNIMVYGPRPLVLNRTYIREIIPVLWAYLKAIKIAMEDEKLPDGEPRSIFQDQISLVLSRSNVALDNFCWFDNSTTQDLPFNFEGKPTMLEWL